MGAMPAERTYVTQYGSLKVTAVTQDHLVIASDFDSPLTVNGVLLRTRWDIVRDTPERGPHWRQVRNLVDGWGWDRYDLSRPYYAGPGPSDSARKKVRAAIVEVLTQALADNLPEEGRIEARNRQIADLDREIESLTQELAEKMTVRSALVWERQQESTTTEPV